MDVLEGAWPTVALIHGWFSRDEAEALVAEVLARPGATVVEIGSYCGRSSACLGLAAQQVGGRLYCIDPFTGTASGHVIEHVYLSGTGGTPPGVMFDQMVDVFKLSDVVEKIVGFSQNVGEMWGLPIDVLFIDGDHAYDYVKKDMELFAPYVKPGGIMALHDRAEDGPKQAIAEFNWDGWEFVGEVKRLYIARKK